MKNKFYLIALVALIGFMSLPLTGCPIPDDGTGGIGEAEEIEGIGGGGGTTVSVTGVTLSQNDISLSVNGTATLTATVAPNNAKNKAVTWSTSDASKVTVTNGVVTAVAVGSATITVTTVEGNKTDTCSVAVLPSIIPAGTTVTKLTEAVWADGNIPTSSDEQWFKFTATASTQYIHVDFGTLTDLYVQVYDSSGTTVGSQTNLYSAGITKYVSRTVTSGQEYYIKV